MAIPNTFADKTGEVLLGNLDYNFEVLDIRISNNQTQIENLDLRIDAIEGIDVDFTGYATETYVNNAVSSLTNSIATKASLSGATFTGDVTFQGLATTVGITEVFNNKTGATGVVDHDFATGSIFYHDNAAANFTANITNVPTTNDRTIGIALVLNQGGTAYIPTALQIDGSAVTIKWADAETPTGSANQFDVVAFTLIRRDGTWYVLATLSTFG